MGVRNKERRREKRKKREQARAGGEARAGSGSRSRAWWGDLGAAGIEMVVLAAVHARHQGDQARVDLLMRQLVAGAPGPQAVEMIERVVSQCFETAVRNAWEGGWQPADLARAAGRELRPAQAQLVVDAIVAEAGGYSVSSVDERWRSQLTALGAEPGRAAGERWRLPESTSRVESLGQAIGALYLLDCLPRLPRLCPLPGEAVGRDGMGLGIDVRVLEKVRGLLAKAESTTFPAEAEALTAKAQELMARHALDRAMVAADRPSAEAGRPVGRRLGVDDPYAGAKAMLLEEVTKANRCRAVWSSQLGFATLFGYEADADTAELLYTSLLVQANAAMAAAGRHGGAPARARPFRQSFLIGYTARIGARIKEAAQAGEAAAGQEYGPRLLPVLAARSHAVDEACDAMFPRSEITSRSLTTANRSGYYAGAAAAELASLATAEALQGEAAMAGQVF